MSRRMVMQSISAQIETVRRDVETRRPARGRPSPYNTADARLVLADLEDQMVVVGRLLDHRDVVDAFRLES